MNKKLKDFSQKCILLALVFFVLGAIFLMVFNDAIPLFLMWMVGMLFYGAYGAIETIREKLRKGEWKIEEVG